MTDFIAPLLAAGPTVALHTAAALAALIIGAAQLLGRKGGRRHRLLGYLWVALMLVVSLSSFGIHELRVWGAWSPIHLLSALTLVSVIAAIVAIRAGRRRTHRNAMAATYCFGLILAGAFALAPGRLLHGVLFGG